MNRSRARHSAVSAAIVLAAVLAIAWHGVTSAAPYPVGGDQGGAYASGGDEQSSDLVAVPDPILIRPPVEFALRIMSANPVGAASLFEFDLPAATMVTARLYDVLGREVARPAARLAFPAGTHQFRIPMGRLAGGLYLCRLQFETPSTGESREFARKLVHLR